MNIGLQKKVAKLKSKRRIKRIRNRENREKAEKSQVDIPHDIVEEILSRLPVKSVLRFKAVSKLWHSTISNPSFQRRCPVSRLFSMSFSTSKDRYELHSIDKEGSIKEFTIPCEIRKGFDKDAAVFSNSCHGVLLISIGTSDIFLVNPSTYYFDAVLKLEGCFGNRGRRVSMGFCYDESIGDYKAVMLISQETVGDFVLVASLREKQWTAIHIPSNFCNIIGGPLLNDRLHCTVRVHRHNDDQFGVFNAILYFNPVKDVFEKVACPQPKSGDGDAIVGLGVLEDCLCMARRIGEEDGRGDVEFLVMKEYGVAKSWTTLFALKNLEVNRFGWFDPLLMTNNGDIWISSRKNIYSYNPAKKLYTKLIKKQKFPWLNVVTFVENILTPNISSLKRHDRRQQRKQ